MDRADLGALCARATQRLIALERPLLEAHGLTMWEYVALSYLEAGPAPTQLALAQTIGYDKTRLIALLDGLEAAKLVARPAAEHDRRARVVSLTAAGRRKLAKARAAVRAMEEEQLGSLPPADRDVLFSTLARLGAAV